MQTVDKKRRKQFSVKEQVFISSIVVCILFEIFFFSCDDIGFENIKISL